MNKTRIALTFICCLAFNKSVLSANAESSSEPPIRFGLTPALLHNKHSLNAVWHDYLEEQLQRPVVFVQRDSYREMMDLIKQGQIDFAWVCSYPYVSLKDAVKLLAVPVYLGDTLYQSYIIVPSSDQQSQSIADLKSKVFAYADPHSNTGHISPRFAIKKIGGNPDTFFKRTFFTWSHRKVIQAVAANLADGGAVESFIWESLALFEPELTAQTRIVSKSETYGFPPLVAHHSVSKENFTKMQTIFLNMKSTPAGQDILKRLNLDDFIKGKPAMYDSVVNMMRTQEKQGD